MERHGILLPAAVIALALGLFVVDQLEPLGLAVWLLYGGVVLLSLWLPSRWQTYATATLCSVLVMVGLFYSPPRLVPFWLAATNRVLCLFSLWVAVALGLSARRTQQLEEVNRRLRQEIAERERVQAQLLRSQRLESIGVLASGIAHDFNNLLTPVLMAVKLLREDRPRSERLQLLSTLQASAERGADVVRQLLVFASGGDDRRAPVHLGQIVQEIKSILDHTFPKTIRLRIEVADGMRPINADATQLTQVLLNLCINARDAMPKGGELLVQASTEHLTAGCERLHPDARPSDYLVISVSDTGIGMSAEILDKVFDPFFTTKGTGKGTGLGLSTAMGIVRGHGGFITVSSEVGRGSRFAVYLPVNISREPLPAVSELPTGAARKEGLILVVDDDPLILQTAQATLGGLGYRVVTAASGAEAVDAYRKHTDEVRAVLLDMMMPGMDGRATFFALEQLGLKAPVIASSGLRLEGAMADALADRGAFLSKPYTEDQLLASLTSVLTKDDAKR